MKLRRATAAEPGYPARRAGRLGPGGRLRRFVSAAAGAVAICLAPACGVIGTPHGLDDEEEVFLAGGERAPSYFVCAQTPLEPLDRMYAPAGSQSESHYWGELCGSETAWGTLHVDPEAEGAVVVTLETREGEGAIAHLISPDGAEVAELSPEEPTATVELTAGDWTVPVTSLSPDDRSSFDISFVTPDQ